MSKDCWPGCRKPRSAPGSWPILPRWLGKNVSCQLSVVSCQLSVVSCQLSVVSCLRLMN
jgi:hypothetical protein